MDKSKQFETLVVIVVALVAGYFFRRSEWWLAAALIIGLGGLVSSWFRFALHWIWMRLALTMGEVSGRVILTVVYLLLLTPVAILARRAGKLGIRRKPGGDSYFTKREHTFKREDLIHPW